MSMFGNLNNELDQIVNESKGMNRRETVKFDGDWSLGGLNRVRNNLKTLKTVTASIDTRMQSDSRASSVADLIKKFESTQSKKHFSKNKLIEENFYMLATKNNNQTNDTALSLFLNAESVKLSKDTGKSLNTQGYIFTEKTLNMFVFMHSI